MIFTHKSEVNQHIKGTKTWHELKQVQKLPVMYKITSGHEGPSENIIIFCYLENKKKKLVILEKLVVLEKLVILEFCIMKF